jgi:DNA-binding transcriptional regulator YhcF (GntR family)
MAKFTEDIVFTLEIDAESQIPKYRQIVNYILDSIEKGKLSIGSRIPSINELSEEFYLSRDTVEKAYSYLRKRNIIKSVKGKGYYIASIDPINQTSVCLIFNKLSAYKKIIFNTIVHTLGTKASVDLFIHHCNPTLFKSIVTKKLGEYNYFMIMPHFHEITEDIITTIQLIPSDKLIILDKQLPQLRITGHGIIFQNFKSDIYNALESAMEFLTKYKKLTLIFPTDNLYPYPIDIVEGFKKFCLTNGIAFNIIDEFVPGKSLQNKKEAFIVIEDSDLAGIIKEARIKKWAIGKDLGILSYNDTPLKEVLAEGISVISTDFQKMGKQAARMILDKEMRQIENPFSLIKRKSL